jgi:hypothetical protein
MHGTVSLTGGSATFTPADGFSGAASFDYTATDGTGQTTTSTVTVTVRPVAAPDSATTDANTPVTLVAATLLADDLGTGLAVTGVANPAGGTVALNGGSPIFTPAAGFSGTASFDYTVTDAAGGIATSTVTVTVLPVATGDTLTAASGTPVTVTGATLVGNDAGTGLVVTSVGGVTHGIVSLAGGSVTFTPTPGYSGNATFDYTATDAAGKTTTAPVAVTVRPTAAADTASTDSGVTLVVTAAALLGNDAGTGLTVTAVGPVAHGTVALVAGVVTFVPTPGFSGTATFDYTVTDAAGGTGTATVTVTVAPVAVDDTETTVVATAVTVPVLGNDLGSALVVGTLSAPLHGTVTVVAGGIRYLPAPGFSGADLFTYDLTGAGGTATATVRVSVTPTSAGDIGSTVAGESVDLDVLANDSGSALEITDPGTPAHGTVSVVGGRIRYVPAARYSGTDTFSYTARDAAGVLRTAVVNVFITPVSAPDAASGPAGSPLVVDLDGNDVGSDLTVTAIGTPAHGTAAILADGRVSFVPPTGWSGIVTMPYWTTDSSGQVATNVATLTIRPTAAADRATTPIGTTVTFGVLGNDVGTGLTVTFSTTPAHGTVTIAADGSAAYTPYADWFGLETLSYTTTDEAGSTATATVSITVTPAVAPVPGIGLANTGSTGSHTATSHTSLAYTGLAYTGTNPWALVAIAILLLMLGVIVVIVARRNSTEH